MFGRFLFQYSVQPYKTPSIREVFSTMRLARHARRGHQVRHAPRGHQVPWAVTEARVPEARMGAADSAAVAAVAPAVAPVVAPAT